MNVKTFRAYAYRLNEEFQDLRNELAAFAETDLGKEQINAVDDTAVRKLLHFPGDITPARLVSISTKIVNRFYTVG